MKWKGSVQELGRVVLFLWLPWALHIINKLKSSVCVLSQWKFVQKHTLMRYFVHHCMPRSSKGQNLIHDQLIIKVPELWTNIYFYAQFSRYFHFIIISCCHLKVLCLNKQNKQTQFHSVFLCLYVADPATFLASKKCSGDRILLWEQLVYSLGKKK